MSNDFPSDQTCRDVNLDLWQKFCDTYKMIYGFTPSPPVRWTEADVTQWFDVEAPELLNKSKAAINAVLDELANIQEWQNRYDRGIRE